MQGALPLSAGQRRQLAVCFLFSVSLHVALLFVMHPPMGNLAVAHHQPIKVYFAAPPVTDRSNVLNRNHIARHDGPSKLLTTPTMQVAPLAARTDTNPSPEASLDLSTLQMMESSKSMAADEAIKTERQNAALEKQRLNTPAGMLAQDVRRRHKETRLANGSLKIETDNGAVCFQSVPYFARDTPGLYGIPTTCP